MHTRYSEKGEASSVSPATNTIGAVMIQPKLTIGAVNDPLEHEADAMADKVMSMQALPFAGNSNGNNIQRKCSHCEEEEKVQRKPLASYIQRKESAGGMVANNATSERISATRGSGNSLNSNTKNFMERRFGTDFGDVKIHTSNEAIQMNRELNAKAFTVGNDIYFNEGQYQPDADAGKHLLAHELTHTVQQGGRTSIQRSCSDGNCRDCAGGTKTIVITAFFRRRAEKATMQVLRTKIDEAKRIMKRCCINLFVNFNWRLLSGGGNFDPGVARPAGDAHGAWDFTNDSEQLGEGTTFSGARGIPMLIVDTVPRTGGGVTISSDFDNEYTGKPYIVIPIGHGRDRAIAHELGHVAHILNHSLPGVMDTAGGTATSDTYCNAVRSIAH